MALCSRPALESEFVPVIELDLKPCELWETVFERENVLRIVDVHAGNERQRRKDRGKNVDQI
jgi:hypothetical protein